jgi:hypothetical protein
MEKFSKTIIILFITFFIINTTTQTQCPKYTCDNNIKDSCASVKSGYPTKPNSVTLSDICKKDEFCDVIPPPFKSLAYQANDDSYKCKLTPAPYVRRFPGEDCTKNDDCVNSETSTGKCLNGKCNGLGEYHECAWHADCLKGLFCSAQKGHKVCTKQKAEGSSCSSPFECQNKFLCHEGKCSLKPFSLENDTQIEYVEEIDIMKCKFGLVDDSLKCAQLNQQQPEQGEYVKCSLVDKCNYNLSTDGSIFIKDCECGYNFTGQGYCPKGHNNSKY